MIIIKDNYNYIYMLECIVKWQIKKEMKTRTLVENYETDDSSISTIKEL